MKTPNRARIFRTPAAARKGLKEGQVRCMCGKGAKPTPKGTLYAHTTPSGFPCASARHMRVDIPAAPANVETPKRKEVQVPNPIVHTSSDEWDNVTPGVWYGCAVIERPNGETDYVYAYSNWKHTAPRVSELVPEGCTLLESTLHLTSKGREDMWHTGDRWAFEDQEGSDAITWDDYDASKIV